MEGKNFKERLPYIRAFVFDIDGVLTDGTLTIHPEQGLIRSINAKDGYALEQAVLNGFKVAIISRARDPQLRDRFLKFGLHEVYLGSLDKKETLLEFCETYSLDREDVLYMGDDVPDIDALRYCGVPTCPNDAVPEVRKECIYISPESGGRGCVRDVIVQVLRVQGFWNID